MKFLINESKPLTSTMQQYKLKTYRDDLALPRREVL